MKPTNFGRILGQVALSLTITLLLPANLCLDVFSQAEAFVVSARDVVQIDHSSRVTHAQELLGVSAVEQADIASSQIAESLETYIRDHVSASLRASDKGLTRKITRAIIREAKHNQMDPVFVMSIIAQESRFNTRALGRHGEIGLMQIKPSTAEWIATRFGLEWKGAESLYDPATNIKIATQYFAWLRASFARRPAAYVAAYNMGPVAVRRKLAEKITPVIYAGDVMGKYRGHYRKLVAQATSHREFLVSMNLPSFGSPALSFSQDLTRNFGRASN
ncbi:MAG: lytic transglycosylase domain-containing protein [Bdellovibrionaceae bacterium]|nr:lytic transglycosylase domain-containing protein [Pseudobdellovibrionaceae bacterium]